MGEKKCKDDLKTSALSCISVCFYSLGNMSLCIVNDGTNDGYGDNEKD